MSDAFDRCPQYNRWYPGYYNTYAINQLAALVPNAGNYAPRFAAVPSDANSSIAGRRTVEGLVTLEPGSVIWGITGISDQSEGFKVQLVESGAERFWQTPVRFDPLPADAGKVHILAEPRLVIGPISAQLANLSTNTARVQLTIFYAEPLQGTTRQDLDCYTDRLRRLQQDLREVEKAQRTKATAAVPFREAAAIATPAAGSGLTRVLSFRCPDGHDGLIRSLSNQYTNPSLVEGSGDIVWRISIDGAYVKGYDAITTTLGSAQSPLELVGPIPVSSGQLVEYFVEHAATSSLPAGGTTQIICTAAGSFFPR